MKPPKVPPASHSMSTQLSSRKHATLTPDDNDSHVPHPDETCSTNNNQSPPESQCNAETSKLQSVMATLLEDDESDDVSGDMPDSNFAPDKETPSDGLEFVDINTVSDDESVGNEQVEEPVVEKVKKGRPKKVKGAHSLSPLPDEERSECLFMQD
jgi:hypothetical protein